MSEKNNSNDENVTQQENNDAGGNGWIKLHRKILKWEWWNDHNTTRLFFYMLIRANHKPKKWKGIIIQEGSFIGSLAKIETETGLTQRQARTAINHLKSTNDITSKSTNKYTLYTVVNYSIYQHKPDEATSKTTSQATSKRQAKPEKTTTNKNDLNKNEEEGLKQYTPNGVDYSPLPLNESQISELKRIRKANGGKAMTQRVVNSFAKEFTQAIEQGHSAEDLLTEYEMRGWKGFKAEWMPPAQPGKPKNDRNAYFDAVFDKYLN